MKINWKQVMVAVIVGFLFRRSSTQSDSVTFWLYTCVGEELERTASTVSGARCMVHDA